MAMAMVEGGLSAARRLGGGGLSFADIRAVDKQSSGILLQLERTLLA